MKNRRHTLFSCKSYVKVVLLFKCLILKALRTFEWFNKNQNTYDNPIKSRSFLKRTLSFSKGRRSGLIITERAVNNS